MDFHLFIVVCVLVYMCSAITLGLLLVQKKRVNIENVYDLRAIINNHCGLKKDTFLKVFFGTRPKTAFDFLKLVQGLFTIVYLIVFMCSAKPGIPNLLTKIKYYTNKKRQFIYLLTFGGNKWISI